VYDVVVKKVHVRYLISWWVSCLLSLAVNCRASDSSPSEKRSSMRCF